MAQEKRSSFRKCTVKPGACFYREIIKKNGFDGKLVQKYLPEMPVLKLFNKGK